MPYELGEKELRDILCENLRLREKTIRQRTELRRLNKTLKAMWEGVKYATPIKSREYGNV